MQVARSWSDCSFTMASSAPGIWPVVSAAACGVDLGGAGLLLLRRGLARLALIAAVAGEREPLLADPAVVEWGGWDGVGLCAPSVCAVWPAASWGGIWRGELRFAGESTLFGELCRCMVSGLAWNNDDRAEAASACPAPPFTAAPAPLASALQPAATRSMAVVLTRCGQRLLYPWVRLAPSCGDRDSSRRLGQKRKRLRGKHQTREGGNSEAQRGALPGLPSHDRRNTLPLCTIWPLSAASGLHLPPLSNHRRRSSIVAKCQPWQRARRLGRTSPTRGPCLRSACGLEKAEIGCMHVHTRHWARGSEQLGSTGRRKGLECHAITEAKMRDHGVAQFQIK